MARRPVHMKKTALSSRKRAALKASDFAVPSERKYPINDLFHARLALTYVLSPSNAAYRDEVVRAVIARYPELQFWWAARSKGVEAKRAKKGTRRAASGRRMVANPMPLRVLSRAGRSVAVFDTWSGFAVATKKGDEDYVPVFRTKDYPAAVDYAEQYLNEFVSNPRRAHPREVETEAYFEAMEPTRSKYAERSPEELLITRSVALKALNKRFAGKSSREVAKALGLDPRDASIITALEDLRSGPYNINPRPALRRNSASTADGSETYTATSGASSTSSSSTQRARAERVAARIAGDMQARSYAQNPRRAQPRGRFEQVDYRKKLRLPAHSPEELFGSLEAGIRAVKPHEDKSNRDIARALGLDAYDPLTLATLENLRDGLYTSNPRRKGAKPSAKQSSGRTAAQSNAAKAMKLFHSGQASSLAEAWAMLRRR